MRGEFLDAASDGRNHIAGVVVKEVSCLGSSDQLVLDKPLLGLFQLWPGKRGSMVLVEVVFYLLLLKEISHVLVHMRHIALLDIQQQIVNQVCPQ